MTDRDIEDRARFLYEAARRPQEIPFDQRAPIIQDVWRSLARLQLRKEAR